MIERTGLLTDLYELTMAQGYYLQGMDHPAVFDYFFRRHPFKGGFTVFAGLQEALDMVKQFRFGEEDLAWLDGLGLFHSSFLNYLAEFRFRGEILACPEGSLIFPAEPVLQVKSSLPEAQLLESLLLNILNFQTLVATKTARVYLATGQGTVLEFGLRRAHGINGALAASRAAFIGGAGATSHLLAGKTYGIPVRGTMAHSWVMAFPSEEEAFRQYARLYPDNCILLIDTYNTLDSGILNAIKIFKELRTRGHSGFGVRLDSGDLAALSREVRRILDAAGLKEVKIAVSNDMDEYTISGLRESGAPIDLWGVGTRMVTGHTDAAFPGVYKLAALQKDGHWQPVRKVSDSSRKTSLPGIKQVYRFTCSGKLAFDLIAPESTPMDQLLSPPLFSRDPHSGMWRKFEPPRGVETGPPLLAPHMTGGEQVSTFPGLREIQSRVFRGLESLPPSLLSLSDPENFATCMTADLNRMVQETGHS